MAPQPHGHAAMPGDILIVIHEFLARTEDELTLRRGDRIELIERDDEFGDGWYLGKHVKTGASGLFPEVYTTAAAKLAAKAPLASFSPYGSEKHDSGFDENIDSLLDKNTTQSTTPAISKDEQAVKPVSHPTPSANAFAKRAQASGPRSLSLGSVSHQTSNPVMNETLSVIEEHITDMHTPRQSFLAGTTYHSNDDDFLHGSANRLSYINGNETDEEDVTVFTEREVRAWSPAQVAEHLEQLGADRSHCQVFQEQEITGDVLLDMDRDTVLLKEFELGTLGRRLALFQKIQRFQTEVKGQQKSPSRHTSQRSPSMNSYSESARDRLTSGGTVLPRIPSLTEDSPTGFSNYANNRQRSQSSSRHDIMGTDPSRHGHTSRPSTTSIRSVPYARRHSSIDYSSAPTTPQQASMKVPTAPSHGKKDSLDRTWRMSSGDRAVEVSDSQPSTASGPLMSPGVESSLLSPQLPDYRSNLSNAVDLDRGYFSSNENETRKFRNLLRKRDSGSHTRAPSDGYSSIRLSGVFKHIRSGSTDSVHESPTHESGFLKGVSRAFSTKDSPVKPDREYSPSIDSIATTAVSTKSSQLDRTSPSFTMRSQSKGKPRATGLRAISDAVTGNEKMAAKSAGTTAGKDILVQSPARTDSSAQSVTSTGKSNSFEEKKDGKVDDLPAAKYVSFPSNPPISRRKMKHETSAYRQGLEKRTPAEQIAGSDYSGWMKKKSKKLGKWHPRLFVLRGRRLSYYYSEDDTEEKGLIDISYHRVLPANRDIITGFHATLRAGSGPVSPEGATLQTAAQIDAENATKDGTESSGMFIFKLVPPRPGTSRVNFTQPKVHFFAVHSLQEGRNWMAALMKATIERDDLKPISSTYKEKTISLGRAKELRVRPKEFANGDSDEMEDGLGTMQTVPEDENNESFKTSPESGSKETDKDNGSDGWSLVNGGVPQNLKEIVAST